MKKTSLFLCHAGAIALLVMVATACANDTLNTPNTDTPQRLVDVEAGAGLRADKPQTRLGYEDNNTPGSGVTVKWTYFADPADAAKNDKFTVIQPGRGMHEFTIAGEPTESGIKASFAGKLTELATEQTLYAFYPAAAVTDATVVPAAPATDDITGIALNISEQEGSLEGLGAKDYMIATAKWSNTSTPLDFSFTHLMAMLRIDTKMPTNKYSIKKVVVTGLDQKRTLNLSDATWITSEKGDITLSPIASSATGNHTFYLMVFPTTSMTELKVVITLAGYTKTFTSAAGITLAGGKRYSINFGNPSDTTGGSDFEEMPDDVPGEGGTGDIKPW